MQCAGVCVRGGGGPARVRGCVRVRVCGLCLSKLPLQPSPPPPPSCPRQVQLEVSGSLQPMLYLGELLESRCKGFYCLTVPPRAALLSRELSGLFIQADKRLVLQLQERAPALRQDLGRNRVRGGG